MSRFENIKLQWIALIAIVKKEINRFLRIWSQTLLPPLISMSLYFLIFGSIIGRRVGIMGGYHYINFVAPGLIMMSIITSSSTNAAFSFFSNKFQKSIEPLLMAPVSDWVIIAGYLFGSTIRGLITGVGVTIVSMLFVKFQVQHIFIALLAAAITAMIFSSIGLISALYAKTFDDVSIIPTFVITPLTYLGGVFYSIQVLPGFWKSLLQFNPIYYQVSTFRYGILGGGDHINIISSFLIMITVCLSLLFILKYLFKKGVGLRT